MLTLSEIQYLVYRYQLLRQHVGPELINDMVADDRTHMREEWLKEYRGE